MGFKIFSGMEFEFFVFEETPHSVREKNYRDMKPLTEGFFGYSMIRNSVQSDLYTDILETAKIMDFEIEGLHEETGAGCMEAAIGVSEGIASADKAALFKTMTKILCQKVDLMATFMAKASLSMAVKTCHTISWFAGRGTPSEARKSSLAASSLMRVDWARAP